MHQLHVISSVYDKYMSFIVTYVLFRIRFMSFRVIHLIRNECILLQMTPTYVKPHKTKVSPDKQKQEAQEWREEEKKEEETIDVHKKKKKKKKQSIHMRRSKGEEEQQQ